MSVDTDILEEYVDQVSTDTKYRYEDGNLVGGQQFQRQQASQAESERRESRFDIRELQAKIGPLEFVGDFSDPDVNITSTRDVREHAIVSGVSEFGVDSDFVIQEKSQRPTEIEVVGWIREGQLAVADELIHTKLVGVHTGRWSGSAVIESVDVDYSRVYHEDHGPVFETTIRLLAVSRGTIPDSFREPGWEPNWWGYIDGEPVGRPAYREQQAQNEQNRLDQLYDSMRFSCVVGNLTFANDFDDPDVNVSHKRNTADHELVTGHTEYRDEDIDYVTQVMGREPPEITVDGWIREDQVTTADNLTGMNRTVLISGRWSGTVVPKDVDVTYTRNDHEEHGALLEVTIDLIGIQKGSLPDTLEERNIATVQESL